MILVTGATAKVGGNVVRMLRQAGAEVRCLVRMGSEYFWLNDTGAQYFFGDLRDPTSLRRAVKGCEFVVHVAGIGLEGTDNHHESTTLQGTKNLIEMALLENVEHLVMVSCIGAGTDQPVAAFDCLRKAEEDLESSGLSYTILRPGPYLDQLATMVRPNASSKKGVMWARGDRPIRPVTARDAAIVAIACLDHPQTRNQTVPLTGSYEATPLELVAEIAAELQGEGVELERRGSWLSRRMKSLALGRRWDNRIAEQRALLDGEIGFDTSDWVAAIGIPLQTREEAIQAVSSEEHPSEDPQARDNRVVHRQFQATVYEPGEIGVDELPDGPLKLV